MNLKNLEGNYRISPSQFLKWGIELTIEINSSNGYYYAENIFSSDSIRDSLEYEKAFDGDLISIKGKHMKIFKKDKYVLEISDLLGVSHKNIDIMRYKEK